MWAAAAMAAPGGNPGKPDKDHGGGLPSFCEEQLEICQDNLGACSGDLGTCAEDLAFCSADLSTCNSDLNTRTEELGICTEELSTCGTALGTCEEDLAACEARALPGDGVRGTPLAYEDCGDGTVVDLNTGLMWEKKVEGGDDTTCLTELHGVFSQCDWYEANLDWIDAVNAENYAGYNDWRLPHVKELQSIVDYSVYGPTMQPVFGLTEVSYYWSATSNAIFPIYAFYVDFGNGFVLNDLEKTYDNYVRAVRSGSCP
jgi:hypothetical protein